MRTRAKLTRDQSGSVIVLAQLPPGRRATIVATMPQTDDAVASRLTACHDVPGATIVAGVRRVALVGSPNAGKTSVFNHVTGSHGGAIELVSVADHTVTARMSGACHGCPAASSTLHDTLQRELRRRAGERVTVCTEKSTAAMPLGSRLLSLMVRS